VIIRIWHLSFRIDGIAIAIIEKSEKVLNLRREIMKWSEPAFCDVRLGFEVTAYVYVR
jgi:coenzyme PQQ precursor peptide PqqA